jgi:hypothetical protein
MKGCLVPLLAILGFLLLLPGLCFLSIGSLSGPSNPGGVLFGAAITLIGAAIALSIFWRGD